ncbi:Macrolide export ATP-binding/permease protein MacB [Paenibacillus konkukensis]|uniref:Macrolide export ATP-binding/permease protein MacB n=1 Tax=Paenibacillus konkukensis TaxID=2020716 RepID=A0ABY4RSE5_9BACL|nr:ABC transporter ATP-binding protein [Paenibacillus konkukensis]UQZ84329.1 Macrolide export ATP-binding/permease protein MacB [Paenibacillus konkukensis]
MIQLNNITKQLTEAGVKVPILQTINLTVEKGEYISIMGPSGSGKSTLMNILGSLDTPTSGEYLFEGVNVGRLRGGKLADFRNRRLGFVFQSYMLIPRLSVRDNVELPLLYTTKSRKEREERIRRALEQVGMSHKAKERTMNLSGGQKQKVAIARAIINDPDLLLADEPSGNLDVHSKEDILQIFQSLHDSGKTIVLVTHDPDVAQRAGRVLVLRNGEWAAERVEVGAGQ